MGLNSLDPTRKYFYELLRSWIRESLSGLFVIDINMIYDKTNFHLFINYMGCLIRLESKVCREDLILITFDD